MSNVSTGSINSLLRSQICLLLVFSSKIFALFPRQVSVIYTEFMDDFHCCRRILTGIGIVYIAVYFVQKTNYAYTNFVIKWKILFRFLDM